MNFLVEQNIWSAECDYLKTFNMANISIKLKNADRILDALKQAPQRASKGIMVAIEKTTLTIERDAKKLAPVNKQSGGGNLRQSIRSSVNGMKGTVEVGVSYAVPVHEGTRPHTIVAKKARVLANKRTGQMFGRVVNHPGTKAQPFLREAVEMNEEKINNYFLDAVKGIIKI